MALVNINAPSSITPLAPKLAVTSTPTDLVAAVATDHAVRINSLILSNIDGVNPADVTVSIVRSATSWRMGLTVSVPADAALEYVKRHYWLLPGDSLQISSPLSNDIEAQLFGEEFA